MNTIQGVSAYALREGFLQAGINDGDVLICSELMDSRSLFLTGNADTVYMLNALVQLEPAEALDTELAGQFAALGIVKDEKFAPDARLRKILDDAAAVGNAASRTLGVGACPTEGWRYYDGGSAWWNMLWAGGFEFTNPPPEITAEGIKPYPNKGARQLHSRTSFLYFATVVTPAMCMRLTNQEEKMTTRTSSCNCGQLSLRYEGPDPERVSLCQCYSCQKRSGSLLSVQTRLRRDHVTIEGESKTFTFPQSGKPPVTYRSCDSSGATYHFCPECGSTLYCELSIAPDFFVVEVGGFTDPTFPPPIISGFEAEGAPWMMSIKDLQLPGGHHDYDGTSHGGARL